MIPCIQETFSRHVLTAALGLPFFMKVLNKFPERRNAEILIAGDHTNPADAVDGDYG